MIIVIDPSKAEGERFAQRSRELVEQMQAVGLTRMPGERRYREREVAEEEGVALTEQELQGLKALLG
ncbi:hypothetical protein D3C81_2237780 [compost metagenome]